MTNRTVIWALLLTFYILAGMVSAGEPEIDARDVLSVDVGEEFEVDIIVTFHEDVANYTVSVTLHPRFEFVEGNPDMVVSGDNASITYEGRDQESIRFEFQMMALNNTPDGDYHIPYSVYWNGSETNFTTTLVESDTVRVSVGEGGGDNPCGTSSFLILPVFVVGTAFCFVKRQGR